MYLLVTGQTVTNNQGISEVGHIGLSTLVGGAVKSVTNIVFYFLEWNVLEHPITLYGMLNIVFIVALVIVIVTALVKSGSYKDMPRLLMVGFCLVASVPVISVWNFLSESTGYRPMMLHSIAVFYIFALMLYDKWVNVKVSTAFGIFIAVVLFNFAVMANISYFYLDKCYEKSFYMGSQMMTRITEVSQNEAITQVAFVGTRNEEVTITPDFPGNRIHMLSSQLETDLLFDNDHSYLFLKNVYGLELSRTAPEQLKKLEADTVVQQMGIWPAKDSVGVIDGVLVIKLAE